MDPQQRLLLECVAEGALSGGLGSSALAGAQRASCGVYVGCSWMDYGRLVKMAQGVTPYSATGVLHIHDPCPAHAPNAEHELILSLQGPGLLPFYVII